MLDHLTPFFALAAAALVLLPLPYHIKSRNVGTLALSIWLFIGNIDGAINSMVWWHSTSNKAAFFCELMYIAIPACNLVIARKLESIASTRQVHATASDQRRSVIFELMITVGAPLVYVAFMIVNQTNRFGILEEAGCWPFLKLSWAWVVLVAAPVIVVSSISVIYSVLAFRWFWIRRRQFQAVLASSASTINQSRYVRLLALTAVDILLFFPIYLGTTAAEIRSAIVKPYGSWSQVHEDFGIIPEYPAVLIEAQGLGPSIIISKIVCPVSGVICFVLFGLGQEARQGYKATVLRALIALKLRKPPKRPTPE
ncbi:pheromone receptor a1 [Moesziomyces aphidis]|uniref:Pheromone receptor a1 n=1 Tax=Moesziomyces aphidis TaxID=84754 RepID=W3VLN1_MOEAP|nr:pheromone receptor a1 [Moesziomyces aphidis]DBA11497.1 TPA_inf: STE3 [Moesziomyces aphidis]